MVGEPWHTSLDNVVLLLEWLIRERDYSREDIMHVMQKPWKWHEEFLLAESAATTDKGA